MAITFSCALCGKSLTTTDDKAGRKAKCPGCGETLTVPEAESDFASLDELAPTGNADLQDAFRAVGSQTCPMCGAKNSPGARTCDECGEKLPSSEYLGAVPLGGFQYAGFWLRFAAFLIDYIVTSCVGGIIGAMIGIVLAMVLLGANNGNPNFMEDEDTQMMFNIIGYAVGIVLGWLYFAFMESSASQGTLGKMAVGIKVVDLDGRRISVGRATGRYFGKILSGLICLIGYIMAGYTEKKQALHDQLAGTLVVRK